jgi:predicted RNA-binding protein YlxR (DUF448 family)
VALELTAEKGPLRRCLVTREQGERGKMIRFVLSPDRLAVPDLAARLPGRGLWLSARRDVLETALRKGGLARAFARAPKAAGSAGAVTLPDDLPGMLVSGLKNRLVEHLGLARRAGQAVAGFTKAREWLVAGRAVLAVEASDGSVDERRRLMSGVKNVVVAWPLEAALLAQVFGRDHAVHVAVGPGKLAEGLIIDIDRLAGISGEVLSFKADE